MYRVGNRGVYYRVCLRHIRSVDVKQHTHHMDCAVMCNLINTVHTHTEVVVTSIIDPLIPLGRINASGKRMTRMTEPDCAAICNLMRGARFLVLEGEVTRRVGHGAPCLSNIGLYLLRQAARNQLYGSGRERS